MKTKMFEIRANGTCIPVIAIKTEAENIEEHVFFRRGGWGGNSVILIKTGGGAEATHDPFEWDCGTMREAHRYIRQAFDNLPNYSVVDVEVILGESERPKTSEIWG